ncbi:DUF3077 domain-containing protein [Pseudomonas entomophila]|uniref:DUF3077 domain-containing protein n=1 Tax=Pseudomonas entomophila TaxID=312306 RepID=UPI0023D87353|nr:DUF3077 domain-containing protein [Pseudomonas entomophila]MDF0732666.1 DUF3077 domain-containing protein [Pseudomonas entomophila]
MDKDSQTPTIPELTTLGVGCFGGNDRAGLENPLFRVVKGHPLPHAVEQATVLMCTVHSLCDLALDEVDEVPTLLTAVRYLSGMAKALAQDMNQGLMIHTMRQ